MANDSSASSKRAPNFTKTEEEILVQLVKKHDKVLECKRTDTNSNILKEETWKTISKEFNSTTGTFRDSPTLRRKYKNLKKKAKKKFADLKCHVKGTGGGEPANIVFDSIDETIQSMLGTQLTGMTSQFDSDATLVIQNDESTSEIFKLNTKDLKVQEGISENNIKIIIEDTTSFDNENSVDKENINEKKDWGKYCPNMLRTQI
ncbi:myb/SANT-like DNA-binding domain-containing protein 3 [Camponotus floridanus]|uniref:myb/SANT-like DNA-binding domain-containing protein 3 n=1 Tax=Camponotus floridanus TaxID=104421 RepID=UPI000DC68821|nr:myb/SANT-like DNA-binding domain-containing protein 3 [Camponotus floridanus]XP_025269513.1 myb/SANT-like DNA-binding domain-containing protein 3 [Camponotus floridanus]XP_025269517.1 myb/SANT-like DNA-binding domain-containing protein 3 [Camponotus floridanus]